ncbi:MAG: hypothetical protein F4Z95_10710 [Gammaproteobacteria bacterium]|nr:hypothetical protein [Gammaproteobacteria bacterium]
MKKLLIVACAMALGACAAQQSEMQSADTAGEAQQSTASQDSAAARREQRRKSDETYVTSLERREKTGSRINRVRRRGEQEEDTSAGKRIETISSEQLDDMDERGGTVVLPSEG